MSGESKPWYKSKTVWFNVISGAGAVLGYIPLTPVTAGIGTAINLALRVFFTDKPVTVLPQS